MIEMFRLLAEPARNARLVLTAVGSGERCLVSDGVIVRERGGFFSAHIDEIKNIHKTGIVEIAGRRVFCDLHGRECSLVVCGGGHVGRAVVTLAHLLGYPVTLIEDRAEFALGTDADRVLCEDFEAALEKVEGGAGVFFVVMTRGHAFDKACLKAILNKESAYVGLMGSRGRVAALKEMLVKEGADAAAVARLHTPIGLAIGAQTPMEIAVSVMAEITQVKSSLDGESYPRDILHAVVNWHGRAAREDMVLATIIDREGASPRAIGTKMLIRRDGSALGSVGGGKVEAETLEAAREMLASEDDQRVITVDLSAVAEGAFCGGRVELLLEKIIGEKQ